MALVKWATISSAAYAALEVKDNNYLYFVTDTKEIYKGAVPYTESTVFVDTLPVKGAIGKTYIVNSTGAGSVWTGSAWKVVIKEVAVTLTVDDTTTPVSGKAVADYVATEVSDAIDTAMGDAVTSVAWDADAVAVKITKGGAETSIPLTKVATDLGYDGATGIISLKDKAGSVLATANIPLDNFVKSGAYDAETKAIVLTLQNGTTISIPASDLIDVYTGGTTNSIGITIGADHVVKADLKLSAEAGNGLTVKDDGLYAEATDISDKMDKLDIAETTKFGNLVIAGEDGNVIYSAAKLGGAAFKETVDATTVATEKAVSDFVTAVKTAIDADITGLETELAAKVATTDVVATINEAAPSATKVTSEAAVVAALSWIVL